MGRSSTWAEDLGLAEARGPAEAGGLVAEAGGWPSAGAEGRELAEAAGVAEAGLVMTAVTKEVSILNVLVSTSSPADAPTAPLHGLGRQSWLYGAQRRPSNGERETHHPRRLGAATPLDAIKPGPPPRVRAEGPRSRRSHARMRPPAPGPSSH